MRSHKAPALFEFTFDAPGVYIVPEPFKRVTRFPDQIKGFSCPEFAFELIVARFELTADLTAITRTATPASTMRVDYQRF